MSANERQPNPCFSFTEREKLYDHVTHNRFLAIVMQPDVDIHEIKEDSNSFGEYLFVTISCRAEQPKKLYTFWGLGYHEHRERLIVDSWQWFESQRKAETLPAERQKHFQPLRKRKSANRLQSEKTLFEQIRLHLDSRRVPNSTSYWLT